jgi:hypothetical protein
MFSFVFVHVHFIKVGSIVFSDLNHGSGGVHRCETVAQTGPHCSKPLVAQDIGKNLSSGFAGYQGRVTQHFLVFVHSARNDIVAQHTDKKLMEFFA